MIRFPQPLSIFLAPDGRTAILEKPFTYWTSVDPNDFGYYSNNWNTIIVPAGFQTDFASVPRIMWSLVDKLSTQAWPSVIHDYLYGTNRYGRKWADAVFLEALRDSGAGWMTRWACWAGVRMGGTKAWDG